MLDWLRKARTPSQGPGKPARKALVTLSSTNMIGYVSLAEKIVLDDLPGYLNRFLSVNHHAIGA